MQGFSTSRPYHRLSVRPQVGLDSFSMFLPQHKPSFRTNTRIRTGRSHQWGIGRASSNSIQLFSVSTTRFCLGRSQEIRTGGWYHWGGPPTVHPPTRYNCSKLLDLPQAESFWPGCREALSTEKISHQRLPVCHRIEYNCSKV